MSFNYTTHEKENKVIVELSFPNSPVEFPFIKDGYFLEIESSSQYDGLTVKMQKTPEIDEQLEKGVIVDGIRRSIVRWVFSSYPKTVTIPKVRTYKTMPEERLEKLENFLQQQTFNIQSIGYGHLKRTVSGAKIFFSKVSEENEYHIKTLGLLHQFHPNILRTKLPNLGFDEEDIFYAANFVRDIQPKIDKKGNKHEVCCREIDDRIAKAVFMSDKIIEGSGAYGVMRTCYFCGENAFVTGEVPKTTEREKSILIEQLEENSLQRDSFPLSTLRLINYQEAWRKKFLEALRNDERWAVDEGTMLFELGLKGKDFEKTMGEFDTFNERALPLVKESRNYLNGKKYDYFIGLLSNFI